MSERAKGRTIRIGGDRKIKQSLLLIVFRIHSPQGVVPFEGGGGVKSISLTVFAIPYINVVSAMDAVKELGLAENLKSMLDNYIIGPRDQLARSCITFYTKCTKPKFKGICIVYEMGFSYLRLVWR